MLQRTAPSPPALEELDREVARLWRRWRATGGDGLWYRVLESGFVRWARQQGVDLPPALAERYTAEAIDAWAAARPEEHGAWNREVKVAAPH